MLTREEVPAYLLRRGLIGPGAIVDGDLVVRDVSSRNRNFAVERRGGPSFFLKQHVGPRADSAMAYEASVHLVLAAARDGIATRLPRVLDRDDEERILVLDLSAGAEDLRNRQLREGRFPDELGADLGRALATLHRCELAASPLARHVPRVLSLHRPRVSQLGELSAGSLELIGLIQGAPGLGARLDDLRMAWRPLAPIHGDAKWENVVLPAAASGDALLKLVDWEHAGVGDPCWDVGSALGEYLAHWAFSVPVANAAPSVDALQRARYPLEAMQPAIRALWEAYASEMALEGAAVRAWLLRTVEMAGARLVHAAWEATQDRDDLSGGVVLLVQLAANVLERPRQAAAALLGLPLPPAAGPAAP